MRLILVVLASCLLQSSTPAVRVGIEIPGEWRMPAFVEVSAVDLQRAYDLDEVTADQQYANRYVRVVGLVASVREDTLRRPLLEIRTSTRRIIQAYDTPKEQALSVRKGEEVTMLCWGSGTGVLGNVRLSRCLLL